VVARAAAACGRGRRARDRVATYRDVAGSHDACRATGPDLPGLPRAVVRGVSGQHLTAVLERHATARRLDASADGRPPTHRNVSIRVDITYDRRAVRDVERSLREDRVLERRDRLVRDLVLACEHRCRLGGVIADGRDEYLAPALRPSHLVLPAA